jgi:ribosomal protein S18 acetylase RimI-like enzyme
MDSSQLISVGPLSPEDWERYRAIRLEALREEPQAFSSTYEQATTLPDEIWRDRLDKGLFSFAFDGPDVVGLMSAYAESAEIWCIVSAYVRSSHRNRGLGRALLRSILADLLPLQKRIVLDVYPDQKAATHLYQSEGFRFNGEGKECRRMVYHSSTREK